MPVSGIYTHPSISCPHLCKFRIALLFIFHYSCKIEEVSSSQHTTQQIITQTAHPLGHSIIATVLKTVKDETYIPVSILDFV